MGLLSTLVLTGCQQDVRPLNVGHIKYVGAMNYPRRFAKTATLPNGNIFICGGSLSGPPSKELAGTTSCELYDWRKEKFIKTDGIPATLAYFSMTALKTNDILIAGGYGSFGIESSKAYLLNKTGHHKRVGDLNIARKGANSLILVNGNVLVVGGSHVSGNKEKLEQVKELEIYDSKNKRFRIHGKLPERMQFQYLIPVNQKLSLFVDENSLWKFDLKNERFIGEIEFPNTKDYRFIPTTNGLLYYSIHSGHDGSGKRLYLFDLTNHKRFDYGNLYNLYTSGEACRLQNGKILFLTGKKGTLRYKDLELFDPSTKTAEFVGSLSDLFSPSFILLPNNSVLLLRDFRDSKRHPAEVYVYEDKR